MDENKLRELIELYRINKLPPEEAEELWQFVSQRVNDEKLGEVMREMQNKGGYETHYPVDSRRIYASLSQKMEAKRTRRFMLQYKVAISVAAIFLVAIGLFIKSSFFNTREAANAEVVITSTTAPTDRPRVLFSDGQEYDLDHVESGHLTTGNGIDIALNDENELSFSFANQSSRQAETLYSTILTPKGRQYTLILHDGTKVFLNAASKITYPIAFSSEERRVTLEGEAYFDVQKSNSWPFVVVTEGQKIEVLGTQFNVSAYHDDSFIRTTLLEGQVKVSASTSDGKASSTILKPNQQASNTDETIIQVQSVNAEGIVAWKNNLFIFEDENIMEIMKKLSRWYDVQIEYRDGMEGKKIGGRIERLGDVKMVMDLLKETGVLNYEMKGGKIIVMK